MSASGQKLGVIPSENKDSINEILPPGIRELIFEYALDEPNNDRQRFSLYTFFDTPFLQKQILFMAYHAGPLNQIEFYIRKAHARNETDLTNTLIKATEIAIIGLDRTIQNDEGMVERLLKLHAELCPETYPHALEQARLAAPPEEEFEKIARETANLIALNKVIDAIKKNDENKNAAIETFREFVRNTKATMTPYRYNLNLIYLIWGAYEVESSMNCWPIDFKFSYQIYNEITGPVLQKEAELPPRAHQILRSGLYYLLECNDKANRLFNIDEPRLLKYRGLNHELGKNAYFDDSGVAFKGRSIRLSSSVAIFFKAYYEQLYQQHQPEHRPDSGPIRQRMSDN